MTAQLEYHGQRMRFEPTRILCLQAHGPLDSDEPNDADILGLLADGYAVFVQLEPGDGTRYGLILTGDAFTINAMRIGATGGEALVVWLDRQLIPKDCASLAPHTEWSRVFFAWWLNALIGSPLSPELVESSGAAWKPPTMIELDDLFLGSHGESCLPILEAKNTLQERRIDELNAHIDGVVTALNRAKREADLKEIALRRANGYLAERIRDVEQLNDRIRRFWTAVEGIGVPFSSLTALKGAWELAARPPANALGIPAPR